MATPREKLPCAGRILAGRPLLWENRPSPDSLTRKVLPPVFDGVHQGNMERFDVLAKFRKTLRCLDKRRKCRNGMLGVAVLERRKKRVVGKKTLFGWLMKSETVKPWVQKTKATSPNGRGKTRNGRTLYKQMPSAKCVSDLANGVLAVVFWCRDVFKVAVRRKYRWMKLHAGLGFCNVAFHHAQRT